MNAPASFPPALRRVAWRSLRQHPWQSLLVILGITIGVAVVVSIDLANASARQAFMLSMETIAGKATHQISGSAGHLDEAVYVDLVRGGLAVPAAPVLSEYVYAPDLGSRTFQLLGVDPFVDAPFRSYLGGEKAPDLNQLVALLTRPGAVLISADVAGHYGLQSGQEFSIEVGGRRARVFVAGLLQPADALSRRALDGLILADIATAQELTGRLGQLDRIDLILPADQPELVQKLQNRLPPGVYLSPAASRQGSLEQMTAAFRLNLTALSLLALVVGLFLIYNTMTFSVVQRRPLFGVLRCLGVTRRELFVLVIGEAAAMGAVGSLLGVGLGILMGRQTVAMVTQTMNDLYFTTTVQSVGIPAQSLIKGGLLGVVASILAAAAPAWEAAAAPPRLALLRSELEYRVRRGARWVSLAGLALILLGVGLFLLPGSSLLAGFGGTLAVILGFALLSAAALLLLMRLVKPLSGRLFGLTGRMAPRSLAAALSRTSVAVAALMVAVAVTIGMSLMIASFRHTVVMWLDQSLQGDVYLSAPTLTATTTSLAIDPAVVQQVRNWPGVLQARYLRSLKVVSAQGPMQLAATTNANIGAERLMMRPAGSPEAIWQAMQAGGVLVSEPLARRLNLFAPGSAVTLQTAGGWQSFPVVGVFYDYSSSEGSLMMAMDVYRRHWQDETITAINLRLGPGADPEQVARSLQEGLATSQRLIVRPNRVLRQEVLAVFDRTFAITAALRILATVVAFIGVLNTLLLLQLEKQREAGILRALGLTGRQLWQLVMLETGLMGLTAGLLALPAGYALALILIYVINQRSFGWTLQLALPPEAFIQALVIALAAALLAGVYPARRMSRMAAADAIRYE